LPYGSLTSRRYKTLGENSIVHSYYQLQYITCITCVTSLNISNLHAFTYKLNNVICN